MSYKIKTTPIFEKDVKVLSKKYKSLKSDLLNFRNLIIENPKAGSSLGNSCYKIRLAIESKNRGKSGGARIITNVVSIDEVNGTIYLLAIYDKADHDNITDRYLKELLKQIAY